MMILSRNDALKLRDLLNRELGTEISVAATITAPVWEDAPVEAEQPPAPAPVKTGFAALSIGDALEKIFTESGRDMRNSELHEAMTAAGHGASKQGISATLSLDSRFANIRHGVWGLKTAPVQSHSSLLNEIAELMGNEPWSIESLASYFNTDAATIKESMMFPGTRFYQVEEGIMQLKPQFHIQ